MKKYKLLLLSIISSACLYAQQTLISNVNFVDVKTGKVIPGQSVLISNDKIEQTGAGERSKRPPAYKP